MPKTAKVTKKKESIPRALREQVWLQNIGPAFEHKCLVDWCQNKITAFDFHVGHNIPESKGGKTNIRNLRPICARCNLSMGNQYTINQWNKMGNTTGTTVPLVEPNIKHPWWLCC